MQTIDPRDMELILGMRKSNADSAAKQDLGLRYPLASVTEMGVWAEGRKIPIILYRPEGASEERLPVFFSIHGGGFVMARAYMDGPYCRRIACQAKCVVINIDYRLSPESVFPAALDDCYAVVRWAYEHAEDMKLDNTRFAIGGYSAGANLSAAVCLMAKTRHHFSLCRQILCYPPLDLTGSAEPCSPDCDAFSKEIESLFNRCYLGPLGDARNPLVSPVFAEDLTGLPPALMIVGSRDGLKPSSDRYAEKLKNAGVPVLYQVYEGMGHAFTHSPCPEAESAWSLMVSVLKQSFASG